MEPNKKKYATLGDLNKDEKEIKTNKNYTGSDSSGTYHQAPENHFAELEKIAKQQEQQGQQKSKNDCKITIYRNGFKVDDEEFVNLNQQQMEKFIGTLKNGQAPEELRPIAMKYGNDFQPDIEVKLGEEYRPPTPPRHVAYAGESVQLGQQQSQVGSINLEAGQIKVDKSKETTNIQLRLHDGQTKQIEINIDDKVQTIFDFVQSIAPVQGTFQLIAGFPPKPLTNKQATIEEADLEDSRIQQKVE